MRQVGCSVIEPHAKYEALAEMQGLFAFRVRSTVVVRSAVNRMVEGSILPVPPNPYQDHKSESSTPYPHLAHLAVSFFKAHFSKYQTGMTTPLLAVATD